MKDEVRQAPDQVDPPVEQSEKTENRLLRRLKERYKNTPLATLFSKGFIYTSKHATGRTRPRNLRAKKKKARKAAYKQRKINRQRGQK
jgi:hypothetical protein